MFYHLGFFHHLRKNVMGRTVLKTHTFFKYIIYKTFRGYLNALLLQFMIINTSMLHNISHLTSQFVDTQIGEMCRRNGYHEN